MYNSSIQIKIPKHFTLKHKKYTQRCKAIQYKTTHLLKTGLCKNVNSKNWQRIAGNKPLMGAKVWKKGVDHYCHRMKPLWDIVPPHHPVSWWGHQGASGRNNLKHGLWVAKISLPLVMIMTHAFFSRTGSCKSHHIMINSGLMTQPSGLPPKGSTPTRDLLKKPLWWQKKSSLSFSHSQDNLMDGCHTGNWNKLKKCKFACVQRKNRARVKSFTLLCRQLGWKVSVLICLPFCGALKSCAAQQTKDFLNLKVVQDSHRSLLLSKLMTDSCLFCSFFQPLMQGLKLHATTAEPIVLTSLS